MPSNFGLELKRVWMHRRENRKQRSGDVSDPASGVLDHSRRARRVPLLIGAMTFTVIGLAGPLILAVGADPTPYAWMIAPLWLVVLGCGWLWARSFFRDMATARAAWRDGDLDNGREG
jgi:hypothetical protein